MLRCAGHRVSGDDATRAAVLSADDDWVMEMSGREIAAGQSESSGQLSENHCITSSKVRAVKLLFSSDRRWKNPLSLRQRRETVDNAHPSPEAKA
jgi:predicted transcriptional regulator